MNEKKLFIGYLLKTTREKIIKRYQALKYFLKNKRAIENQGLSYMRLY